MGTQPSTRINDQWPEDRPTFDQPDLTPALLAANEADFYREGDDPSA